MNQPPDGARSKNNGAEEDQRRRRNRPRRRTRRGAGKGWSRAPSICGSSKMPIASTTGTANKNIITVPCMREYLVVGVLRSRKVLLGTAS